MSFFKISDFTPTTLFDSYLRQSLIEQGEMLIENRNANTMALAKIILASQDEITTIYPFAIFGGDTNKVHCLCKSNNNGKMSEPILEIDYLEKLYSDYPNSVKRDMHYSAVLINSLAWMDETSKKDSL